MSDRWYEYLTGTVPDFLASLASGDQPGRYLPCTHGLTPAGRDLALGFSCLALKLDWMLGGWATRAPAEQQAWIAFISSFQTPGTSAQRGAFIDPAMARAAEQTSWLRHVYRRLRGVSTGAAMLAQTVRAETKQALATLAEVGARPREAYRGHLDDPAKLRAALAALPWETPWAAGGQASADAVFAVTEAPHWLGAERALELQATCAELFDSLADEATGAYFRGATPPHGNLINGAMKVLTGLDWLARPIHHPGRLLHTCLAQPPQASGCHLVDWVYVVYRCVRQEPALRPLAVDACASVLGLIEAHRREDGGMSYSAEGSQTHYYAARISTGELVGDLHGTILLTWAVIMLLQTLEARTEGLQVVRP